MFKVELDPCGMSFEVDSGAVAQTGKALAFDLLPTLLQDSDYRKERKKERNE